MATGSAIILFAGGLWIAYTHHPHLRPGEIPVITADSGPVKVKPDDPGGMDIPFQDTTVYDQLSSSKTQHNASAVEHLLQPPEQPMAKPEAVPQPDAAVPQPPPGDAKPAPTDADTALAPPPWQETAPASIKSPLADTNALSQPPPPAAEASPPPPAAPATEIAAPPPPPQAVTPAPVVASASDLPPPPPPKPAQPVPAAVPAPVTPAPQVAAVRTVPTGAPGPFAVQLGAYHDQPTAAAEWQLLKAAHPQALGNLNSIIERADLGVKGVWYRLKAGPLSEDSARQTCDTLKSANVTCFPAPR